MHVSNAYIFVHLGIPSTKKQTQIEFVDPKCGRHKDVWTFPRRDWQS